MAIYKCKMCGAQLDVQEHMTIAECDYCGTKQTLPTSKDENIQGLFNRANILRMKSEFDKAEQIYEKILQADDTQAEAYWGLILCKFGIEYVEDPKTFKRIPTCHRTSFDSVIADDDYKSALQYADGSQRVMYEAEANEIDRLQKEALALSQQEDPYDVFICYKENDDSGNRTQDSVIANDIYHQLTAEGFKVFYAAITLEDKLGSAYEPCIFAALNTAKVMLVIGTRPEYFNAVWVKNEWSRYLKMMKADRTKLLIPCYRDMDAYELPEEFAHLQAQDMSKIGFINDVVRGIKKVIVKEEPKTDVAAPQPAQQAATDTAPLLRRAELFLEDGEWQSADEYCEKALDLDPECGKAYALKLLAKYKKNSIEQLDNDFEADLLFKKAMRFGDAVLKAELETALGKVKEAQEQARLEAEQKAREEAERKAEEAERKAQEEAERKQRLMRFRVQRKLASRLIAAGMHTVGLRADGTVMAVGYNEQGQCDVHQWKNIIAITASISHTVGLKADGTAIAVGYREYGQCDVSTWKNITAIAAGWGHTVGLKEDNKVVAVGHNKYGQCNVSSLNTITAIAAGGWHTVGLKEDGTVAAVGYREYGQCDVSAWKNIVAIAAGWGHTVGLKADGTVVAVGYNTRRQCNISTWKTITAIATGGWHTVGLKEDGTVVAVGDNEHGQCNVSDWENIVAIAAGKYHTVGLTADGTIVVAGENKDGQCDVGMFQLFDDFETLEEILEQTECNGIVQLKREAEKRAEQDHLQHEDQERQARLRAEQEHLQKSRREQGLCQHCGGEFKGLFTKKCSSCGRPKDY